MSSTRGTPRPTPRLIGPVVLDLVETLARSAAETVEIRMSATLAAAIARIDAPDGAPLGAAGHPAHEASTTTVTVERLIAERWNRHAWQAVGEGLVPPADAQALSDQLTPRGAA